MKGDGKVGGPRVMNMYIPNRESNNMDSSDPLNYRLKI
jgi:hypothetical protein